MKLFNKPIAILILVGSFLHGFAAPVLADDSFLSLPLLSKNTPSLKIIITRKESLRYGWKPLQKIRVRAYLEKSNGKKEFIRDRAGKIGWNAVLNFHGEAKVSVIPQNPDLSGKIVILANRRVVGEKFLQTVKAQPDASDKEKILFYDFPDGAKITVHYTETLLAAAGEKESFAKEVLDAAVLAYQTIAGFKGFSTQGYSFASPDKNYAYDPDSTLDIYLGETGDDTFKLKGFDGTAFRDAPCFDTVQRSTTQFHAAILLPVRYREFIKNWERMNPSSLGRRNINVDLRGTLMHEMLHAVIFYYNKNLNKDIAGGKTKTGGGERIGKKNVDWYVEGLARYFETFGGARHDFFSQGFKQVLPDKIRFSRGGSNYFMRYPDQAFTHLRYENALFWRFIDYHYGMGAIEELSRNLRGSDSKNYRRALEKITGLSFEELLKKFASAILFKDFGLKEDSQLLWDVARTRLIYRNGALYMKDGFGSEKLIGNECKTDWVGEWGGSKAKFGEMAVAGDATEASDVSGWATDYYEIALAGDIKSLPRLSVFHEKGRIKLAAGLVLVTKAGSTLKKEMTGIFPGEAQGFDLEKTIRNEGLKPSDIEKLFLLVTNVDPDEVSLYSIRIKP